MSLAAKIPPSRFWLLALGATASMGLLTAPAHAGYMASNDESFSYTGTVTAPSGTAYTVPGFVSTPGSTTYTGRDASIYATSNAPTADAGAGYENTTMFLTNWYASLDGLGDGSANPNNTDKGFVQLYDTTSAGVTSATGGWTNAAMTDFRLIVTSTVPTTATSPRLWAAGGSNGPSGDTAGEFLNYTLTLNATFASGATYESPHWFSTTADPTNVTGSFVGQFQNTSTTTPSNDGLYGFDLTFQDGSWAGANKEGTGSYFGATVPEPATFVLFGTALLGFVLLRRRHHA